MTSRVMLEFSQVSALNDGLSNLEQKLTSTSAELDVGREADKQQVHTEFQEKHEQVQVSECYANH